MNKTTKVILSSVFILAILAIGLICGLLGFKNINNYASNSNPLLISNSPYSTVFPYTTVSLSEANLSDSPCFTDSLSESNLSDSPSSTVSLSESNSSTSLSYIKWVDFNIPSTVMEKALNLDIEFHKQGIQINWIEILSYLGTKCGGNYSNYKSKDLEELSQKLKNGETIANLSTKMKNYNYFYNAYNAVLKGFVGEYKINTSGRVPDNQKKWQTKYGLKVFSPIARGYAFSHYDDFGDSRSYGFKRKHLGNDLMGSVGTPIIAIESGYVEVMGWNIYGGWRIGIRSFDDMRYYYYAHLQKDTPFQKELYKGKVVKAGDVIGYLGMTGYSTKENVSNIKKPHLHFGMQIIFNESQKDGVNQIWIDAYNIIEFLQRNKSGVYRDPAKKDFYRINDIEFPEMEQFKPKYIE